MLRNVLVTYQYINRWLSGFVLLFSELIKSIL